MPMEQTAGSDVKPEDVSTSSGSAIDEKLSDLEERINSLERLIMIIVDKLELDYPGIVL